MKDNEIKAVSTGDSFTNKITKLENLFHHAGKVINNHYHDPLIINITFNVTGEVTKEEMAKTVSTVVAQIKKDCGKSSETVVAVENQIVTSGVLLAGTPIMLLKTFCELAKVVGKEMLSVKPVVAEPVTARSFLSNSFSQPSPAMVAAMLTKLLLVI